MVELYLHSPKRFHGIVLNQLSTGTTSLFNNPVSLGHPFCIVSTFFQFVLWFCTVLIFLCWPQKDLSLLQVYTRTKYALTTSSEFSTGINLMDSGTRSQYIVSCRAIYRQRLGKHVPTATDTHATIEVPYESGVEYMRRSLANHRRRRKGNPVPRGITGPPCF
jgi:hypothetical protein